MTAETAFLEVAAFDAFEKVTERDVFQPVDETWTIGLSDVVGSTKAIADGRYKAVNMAGAAVISAVMNALGGRTFPFVFGGDGASFLVDPGDVAPARDAMAATARWVEDELQLALRVALIPVSAVREAGFELLLARYQPCKAVSYAMFSGGGLQWAEAAMKAGEYAITPAPPGARADLRGLSCRWKPIAAERGQIISLIVKPATVADQGEFAAIVAQVLGLIDRETARHGHPVAGSGPEFALTPAGLDMEARATRGHGSLLARKFAIRLEQLFGVVLSRLGLSAGGFDPRHYRRQTAANTDFRKYDDGLLMTLDCSHQTADHLESLLQEGAERGLVRFGLHRQSAALMTCIVPSYASDDHMHFLDGAGGGYAAAALQMRD